MATTRPPQDDARRGRDSTRSHSGDIASGTDHCIRVDAFSKFVISKPGLDGTWRTLVRCFRRRPEHLMTKLCRTMARMLHYLSVVVCSHERSQLKLLNVCHGQCMMDSAEIINDTTSQSRGQSRLLAVLPISDLPRGIVDVL